MEMNQKKHRHQFFTHWYAGDEESDDWFSYLYRNLHHLSGEDVPFHEAGWTFYEKEATLHDEVLDRLYQHPGVDASNITIYVVQNRVILNGQVNKMSDKKLAAEIIRDIPEVWDVQNDLIVRPNAQSSF